LLFRGLFLASSRADSSSSLVMPSRRLSADPLTMLPPPPRTVVPPSGLLLHSRIRRRRFGV
jgi:hypothetical protein